MTTSAFVRDSATGQQGMHVVTVTYRVVQSAKDHDRDRIARQRSVGPRVQRRADTGSGSRTGPSGSSVTQTEATPATARSQSPSSSDWAARCTATSPVAENA